MASFWQVPQIIGSKLKFMHTFGLSTESMSLQSRLSSSCIQRTPDNFPCGIPGINDEIEGVMQHAPQSGRHLCVSDIIRLNLGESPKLF